MSENGKRLLILVKIYVSFSDDQNKSKGVMQVSDDWFTFGGDDEK